MATGNVRYYYAQVDNFGVLCVDEVDDLHDDPTPELIATDLADQHPDAIYFYVEKPQRFRVFHVVHNDSWIIKDEEGPGNRIVASLQGKEGKRLIEKVAAALNAGWEARDEGGA